MQSLSINQLTTYRWTLDEDVHFAKQVGFDSIGLWRRKVSDFGEHRTIELLDDAGLTVSSLGFAGGFTGGDGRSLDESIRDGLAAVGAAERLDAGCLIVVAGGQNNHIRPHRNRLFRLAIEEMLMAAEVANVTLAIKPMHANCGSEWTFFHTIEESLRFVDIYNSSHLKLVYDHYHFPELVESPALVADLVPRLALVQLGDTRVPHGIEQERCPLGEGLLPVWETVAALQYAGYSGCFDVELMGAEIELADYETLLASTFNTLQAGLRSIADDRPQPISGRVN